MGADNSTFAQDFEEEPKKDIEPIVEEESKQSIKVVKARTSKKISSFKPIVIKESDAQFFTIPCCGKVR